jgi:CRISPR-associated protein Cst2
MNNGTIYSLSLSAQATMNMHSLNNEGSEGNQIQTRMVDVVGADNRLHTVNAISGDMFKHIFAEHLQRILAERGQPLCAGCRALNPNRINADPDFQQKLKDKSWRDVAALDELLQRCALDDIAGNLITAEGRSIPRKSVVEFGWVLGVPEQVRTDSYFHVKYAGERGEAARAEAKTEELRGANLGQNIFHRPASSGQYAVVAHVELGRVGRNEITRRYAIDEEARAARAQALLEALLYTFIQPTGAMRATQLPHLSGFRGVVTLSRGVAPAPMTSPLAKDFEKDIEQIVAALNGLHDGALQSRPFNSMAGYAEIMREVVSGAQPMRLE